MARARDGLLSWRVVAGNGRALAVSAAQFGSDADALHALRVASRQAHLLTFRVTHAESTTDWSWTAFDGGDLAVAAAAKSFGRYGTCVSASRRFLLALQQLTDEHLSGIAEDGPASPQPCPQASIDGRR